MGRCRPDVIEVDMSKISDMPISEPLTGEEDMEIVQGGVNRRTSPAAITEHVNAQLPGQIRTYLNESDDIIDLGEL